MKFWNKISKINMGAARTLFMRAKNDFAIVISLGVYIKVDAFEWWQIPAVIIYFILRTILDHKRTLRQELRYIHERDAMFMEMYNKIKGL